MLQSGIPEHSILTDFVNVEKNKRTEFENKLKLGKSILEGGDGENSKITPSAEHEFYLPVIFVNSKAIESSYFGWDIYSDKTKKETLNYIIQSKNIQASKTFLLESGNVAVELFIPVLKLNSLNKLSGIIGVTVDLAQLLGEEQWSKGVEITLTTILTGEKMRRIYLEK